MRWLPIVLLIAASAPAARAAPPPDGPALASGCSGCHAVSRSVETPVPRIIGVEPARISAAMREFRAGDRPGTVMGRIAKGFTDAEIDAIAVWLGAQRD
ncbi:MAG: cytochrome C [Rhodospirillales bacterium]|nr:MAG: cytochrome C [Rhodospirillales bacterium]